MATDAIAPVRTRAPATPRDLRRRFSGRAIALGAGLSALLVAGGLMAGAQAAGISEEGMQLANRYLARASFLVFALAFAASSLRVLWPSETTRALLRNRRALGLGFATIHWIHAVSILWMIAAFDGEFPDPVTLVFGGGGFVASGALALTSNDASVRALGGRRWKQLHKAGVYYLWFIFTFTYFGRVAGGSVIHWPFLAASFGLVALRAAAWLRVRARRRAAA